MQGARPQRALFPLPVSAWIGAANTEGVDTRLDCFAAEAVVRDPGFWQGLGTFHRALCQCEFINKKLQTIDELNRLRTKAEYSETARADAYGELVNVLAERSGPGGARRDPAARRSGARRVLAGRRAAAGHRPLAPRSRSEADLRSARVVDRQGVAAAHASGRAARRLVPPRPRPDGRAARATPMRRWRCSPPHRAATTWSIPRPESGRRSPPSWPRACLRSPSASIGGFRAARSALSTWLASGCPGFAETSSRWRRWGSRWVCSAPSRRSSPGCCSTRPFLRPTARWSCRSCPRCSWWR